MGILDYIKPVETITADKFREMIKDKNIDDYNLIDVRQLKEYEQEHIPGSVFVPIGELENHLNEFNPDIPTIAYCAIGGRSRAAASILSGAEFKEVYSLAGGIKAWNGTTVAGPPDQGIIYYQGVWKPDEIIALSWALEEGTRRFYEELANLFPRTDAGNIYAELSRVEENHKSILTKLYYKVKDSDSTLDYPDYFTDLNEAGRTIEGGLKLDEALAWAKDKNKKDILDFTMSMEAQQYDLYMRLMRLLTEEDTKMALGKIAQEEKGHLEKFTELYEKEL